MQLRLPLLTLFVSVMSAVTAAAEPELFGIGTILTFSSDGPAIRSVVPDSPAARAKLQPGQIISRIAGTPTAGLKADECVKLIRGAEGTPVQIEVTDPNNGKTTQVTLIRATIEFQKKPE